MQNFRYIFSSTDQLLDLRYLLHVREKSILLLCLSKYDFGGCSKKIYKLKNRVLDNVPIYIKVLQISDSKIFPLEF